MVLPEKLAEVRQDVVQKPYSHVNFLPKPKFRLSQSLLNVHDCHLTADAPMVAMAMKKRKRTVEIMMVCVMLKMMASRGPSAVSLYTKCSSDPQELGGHGPRPFWPTSCTYTSPAAFWENLWDFLPRGAGGTSGGQEELQRKKAFSN